MNRLGNGVLRLLRILLGTLAALLLLAATYVSVGRQLLPLVGDYRAEVEARASEALGMPLHIGVLQGRWQGFTPRLLAEDVSLGEGEQRLQLARLRVVPDLLGSLLARQLRFSDVQLEGLSLTLRQGDDGWQLDGLPSRPESAGGLQPQQLKDALQRLKRLAIFDSHLQLQPRQGPALALADIETELRNQGARQRLDLRLHMPDGQPLAARVEAELDGQRWLDSRLRLFLDAPSVDWASWLPESLPGDWQVGELLAGGQLWLDWADGAAQRALLRLRAPRLQLTPAGAEAQSLEQVQGDLYYQRDDSEDRVQLVGFGLQHADQHFDGLRLIAQRARGATDQAWQLGMPALELAPLRALIEDFAPLPAKARAVLDELAPHGRLENLQAQLAPQREGAERLAFSANLVQVGFSATHGAPAAENVSGSVRGNLGGGELRIDSRDMALHLNRLFPEPWRFREAHGRLDWTLDAENFTLAAPYLRVSSEEGELAGDFFIHLPLDPAQEGYMDLRVGMTDGDARFTSRFLPSASPAFDVKLDHWLRTAIKGGRVKQGYFLYQGSLAKHAAPISRRLALFFDVEDAELDYQPGWPTLREGRGQVRIEDHDVSVQLQQGRVLDTQVHDALATVRKPDPQKPAQLSLRGNLDSSLADGLHVLQDSPLPTAKTFAGWTGEGALQGRLALDMALAQGARPKVSVDFSADGASLDIPRPRPLSLRELRGDFNYDSERGLSAPKVSGRAFDREVSGRILAEGRAGRVQSLLDFNGQIDVAALQRWGGVPQSLPASGTLPYRLRLWLGEQDRLRIDSNLRGVTLDLPAPFGKAPGDERYLDFRMSLDEQPPLYHIDYAELASLVFRGDLQQLAEGSGELRLGDGLARLPAGQGLRVRGRLQTLDPKPWQAVYQRYAQSAPEAADGASGGALARRLLDSVQLHIGELPLGSLAVQDVDLNLRRAEQAWRLGVSSRQVAGELLLADADQAPLQVRLQHLRLPASKPAAEGDTRKDPLADFDPHAIPALDLSIEQLYQGDDLLGSWRLEARPQPAGVAFEDVDLQLKGLHLTGAGHWLGTPGSSRSDFAGRLRGGNLGDVLLAWGFAPTVTSEDFRVDLDGGWSGSPAAFDARRFSGELAARFRNGQFVEVQGSASALRVFGLLNFQAIGRRLRLDFTDLLGRGLSYDQLRARLQARDGVYQSVEPLTLAGPSTNLELQGLVDLPGDRVDADLRVSVPLTSNLPLAALIVGAPAVGGALFLADKLIGSQVSRLASVQYRISGSWQDPQIKLDKPFDGH